MPFGDHALYVDPRDDKIALKLMAGRCWQRSTFEAALEVLKAAGVFRSGGVFVDVGANVGALSIYALKSGAFSKAIAIEPDPHNSAILRRNISLNGFDDRMCAIDAAASASAGDLQLVRHRKNHGAHSVETSFHSSAADCITVRAVTLDDVAAQIAVVDDVALVKIDVERHELAVLEGMGTLLRVHVPILMEFTAERGDAERLRRLKALLGPHYDRVLDLSHAPAGAHLTEALPDLTWRASQSDLLIF